MVGNNQKLKKKKLLNKKFNYIIFYTIIFICILFINIGFSAFQNKLSIENISTLVRIDKDVRIAGINVDSISNGTSYYEEYSTFNISGSVSLDNIDSYVIYDVDVYNLGNVSMGIREASISNENLKFEFLDYDLKSKICENDQCTLGVKEKIKGFFKYFQWQNWSDNNYQ